MPRSILPEHEAKVGAAARRTAVQTEPAATPAHGDHAARPGCRPHAAVGAPADLRPTDADDCRPAWVQHRWEIHACWRPWVSVPIVDDGRTSADGTRWTPRNGTGWVPRWRRRRPVARRRHDAPAPVHRGTRDADDGPGRDVAARDVPRDADDVADARGDDVQPPAAAAHNGRRVPWRHGSSGVHARHGPGSLAACDGRHGRDAGRRRFAAAGAAAHGGCVRFDSDGDAAREEDEGTGRGRKPDGAEGHGWIHEGKSTDDARIHETG